MTIKEPKKMCSSLKLVFQKMLKMIFTHFPFGFFKGISYGELTERAHVF